LIAGVLVHELKISVVLTVPILTTSELQGARMSGFVGMHDTMVAQPATSWLEGFCAEKLSQPPLQKLY